MADRVGTVRYQSYWEDMIATDYGIPQIRNRTFCVSLLGEYAYSFPQPIELEKRLKDMLEDKVDEKYYLSERALSFFTRNAVEQKAKGNGFGFDVVDVERERERVAKTITNMNRPTDTHLIVSTNLQFSQQMTNTQEQLRLSMVSKDTGNSMSMKLTGGGQEIFEIKPGHGYFPGSIRKADKIAPIDTGTGSKWHTVIGEKAHINTFNKNMSEDASFCINTRVSASNHDFIVEKNLKQKLCDELIADGKVSENDVIRHSYTNARTDDGRVETNNLSPTLDTRADCFGVVVKDEVITIGNYSPSGHNATRIVDPDGVSPTVMENHGQVTAITENDKD